MGAKLIDLGFTLHMVKFDLLHKGVPAVKRADIRLAGYDSSQFFALKTHGATAHGKTRMLP